jgi:hypothetical protein
VFDARLKSRRPDREVARARSAKPVDLLQLEMVQDCFCRGKENALAQRTALTGPIKGDDGKADLRQWHQDKG